MYAALASRMSVNDSHEMEAAQRAFCRERNAHFVNAPSDSKPGFALVTEESRPMNGLRDPPAGDTNGWYIWFGEELSTKKMAVDISNGDIRPTTERSNCINGPMNTWRPLPS
jgi:hypothetical protein